MEKKSEQPALEQLGLSRNARKLLRGLEARGVKLDPSGVAYHIGRNPGQGMMNKAAGEIGPTWYLLAGPGNQSFGIRHSAEPVGKTTAQSLPKLVIPGSGSSPYGILLRNHKRKTTKALTLAAV